MLDFILDMETFCIGRTSGMAAILDFACQFFNESFGLAYLEFHRCYNNKQNMDSYVYGHEESIYSTNFTLTAVYHTVLATLLFIMMFSWAKLCISVIRTLRDNIILLCNFTACHVHYFNFELTYHTNILDYIHLCRGYVKW